MEIVVLIIAVFVYLILKKYIDYILALFIYVVPDIVWSFLILYIGISVINYLIHRGKDN